MLPSVEFETIAGCPTNSHFPQTSVVQRQLWLLNNTPDITKTEAYDIARREFYQLRLQEDIERRVAAEEAEATGAEFGPNMLSLGMELEDKEFERWKEWAQMEAQLLNQKAASFSGAPESAESEDASVLDKGVEEGAAVTAEPTTRRSLL